MLLMHVRRVPIRTFVAPRRGVHTLRPPPPPYDILFCGTDGFAVAALESLLSPTIARSIRVLTPPDVKHSWGASQMRVSPVKQVAQKHGIEALEVPADGLEAFKVRRSNQLPAQVKESAAPLLVTASFGHLVPSALLAEFRSPSLTLNLHPSLLPELRGAAPIQWAIARQLQVTGVSVQQLSVDAFDRGAILGQEQVPVPENIDYRSFEKILAQRGSDLLRRVVATLPDAHDKRVEQDDSKRTSAPKLHARHAQIKWSTWPARTVDARLRAFGYAFPLTTMLVPATDSKSKFRPAEVLIRAAHACDDHAAEEFRDVSPGYAKYIPSADALGSQNRVHGGVLTKYAFDSESLGGLSANINVFVPPKATAEAPAPVLYYLSGLTCTEDNAAQKGNLFEAAAKYNIALVFPDTSPRGANLPGEDDSFDFGTGAGFYVNATQEPYSKNYRMYDHVAYEIPKVIAASDIPIDTKRASIMGHSMGGHGALVIYLREVGTYRSASAFAPISHPTAAPWGVKAFTGYLGSVDAGKEYDATELLRKRDVLKDTHILVDCGTADGFYEQKQLLPEDLIDAAKEKGFSDSSVTLRLQPDYDHSCTCGC
ncbi:S-formylglutathione hydrolase [Malassezia cuniculi]|uniref:S-formylglutathione hydrolase n=1 Tax=Malassezia cuniculi TaxID=948313 RepID=A0AAF0J5L8_9BASI|nr:S-formylglutathione hydrolase [Malassezia cuniculi]